MLQRYCYSHVSRFTFLPTVVQFSGAKEGHISRSTSPAILAAFLLFVVYFMPPALMAQNTVPAAGGGGITFSSLSGANNSVYAGSTEGDFSVTPTSGQWFKSITTYGNPVPSIYDGPTNSPGIAVLLISDSAGKFTFSSFDYSSNNGLGTYDIQGFLGAVLQYEETGTLSPSFPPNFGFMTQSIANSSTAIDGLQIALSPESGTTSINLDNIMVATVPEPGSLSVIGLGVAVAFSLRHRRRR